MTQRVEVFFFILTQRIETLYFLNVSKNWTSLSYELLFYTTQRIEFFSMWRKDFFKLTPRVEPTFFHDSKKWPCFSKMTHWIESFFFEDDFFFFLTQRIELNFFFQIERMELCFEKNDSNNWTSLMNITQKDDSKNWTFSKHDSQNCFLKGKGLTEWNPSFHWQKWTLLFNMTHSIEPFFSTWLKEWFFFLIDSKNWTLCQKKSLKEWNFFLILK